MQTARWSFPLLLLAFAGCKEPPALSGKYKGSVNVQYASPAPGGRAPLGEDAADEVEITPLENNQYKASFGACSAIFKRPEKSYEGKGIWKLVKGGPCKTKQGDATISSGEIIDFGDLTKGSFTMGLEGLTQDDKYKVSWTYITHNP
jgi:hypothetical protein